jgi:ABC-type multidrug transport system fused ATPase/permease subunit
MNVLSIFRRFLPNYKRFVALSLVFNLIAAVFSLFSFAAIIPILQMLFGVRTPGLSYMQLDWSDSMTRIAEVLRNNLNWWMEEAIRSNGPVITLLLVAVFLIVMTALKVGFAYMGVRMTVPIRTGVVRDIRNQMFRKIVALPIGFFTEERKGDILSRITADVTEVEISIINAVEMIFKNPVLIGVYLVVLFAMSWQMTVFVILLLPVSGWLIGRLGKNLKRNSSEAQAQQGELLSQLDETLGGLRVVKAFNAEAKVADRFAALNEKIRKTFNDLHYRYHLAFPMSEFTGTVVIALLLWFGGMLILNGSSGINAAEFIFYLIMFYSIINPAKDLSRAMYGVRKGMAALERIDKIMNAENTVPEPENPVPVKGFSHSIEYRNLSFRYQTDYVLRNINLTIPKGHTVALVGQSGSGKTTLIDLFPKFYKIEEGEILLDGVNIASIHSHELRKLIGNVNQEAILFNDSFYNNIAFGVENATMDQVVEAAKIANAHDFIMATGQGYDTNIGDRGSKLSGGQRQRISIARAILKNPPVLILDEATSALDTESEKMVQEALDHLMQNRTTLVVAHRLSTIKKADEICVMHEGRIVERGRHDDLMAMNGYYKKLVEMQSF